MITVMIDRHCDDDADDDDDDDDDDAGGGGDDDGDDNDDDDKERNSYPPSTAQVAPTLRPPLVGCLKATTRRVMTWRCGCASFV